MTKTELLNIGLTPEQVREVQKLHGRDIVRHKERGEPEENQRIRDAIAGLLPMLRRKIVLKQLLAEASRLYYEESQRKEKGRYAVFEEAPKQGGPDEEAAKVGKGDLSEAEQMRSEITAVEEKEEISHVE